VKLNPVFFIAKRLLLSRQKKTAVSVISWIAVLGMLVSSAAMVILLSAFNGIEGMIEGLYTEFDQEIIVRPSSGKKIPTEALSKIIAFSRQIDGVSGTSLFIQDRVMLRKKKKWSNAELWAVEPSFCQMSGINKPNHLVNGKPLDGAGKSLIGVALANKLGLHSMDFNPETVVLYIPRQDRKIRIGKSPFFQEVLSVAGAVDYNKEVNEQVLVTDLTFAQGYFNNEVSGLLIATTEARRNTIKDLLSERFPKGFIIQTNLEKNALIFKTSRSEKLIVIIILVFIFILSLFNLSASLTMTFLEKKPQFTTMYSLGMSSKDLNRVFLTLGMIIVALGVVIGLSLGAVLVGVHERFHLITIPGTLKAFPSEFDALQVFILMILLFTLGFLATRLTTSFLMNSDIKPK
jgi:lipoprotein-releasing system permease protein